MARVIREYIDAQRWENNELIHLTGKSSAGRVIVQELEHKKFPFRLTFDLYTVDTVGWFGTQTKFVGKCSYRGRYMELFNEWYWVHEETGLPVGKMPGMNNDIMFKLYESAVAAARLSAEVKLNIKELKDEE